MEQKISGPNNTPKMIMHWLGAAQELCGSTQMPQQISAGHWSQMICISRCSFFLEERSELYGSMVTPRGVIARYNLDCSWVGDSYADDKNRDKIDYDHFGNFLEVFIKAKHTPTL